MPEFHLPRLSSIGVGIALATEDGLEALAWQDRALRYERYISWGVLGARRASEAELQALRDRIVEIARHWGFPEPGPARESRAGFDLEVAKLLGGEAPVPMEEALRDDVWSWIATILLPDVTFWRFQRAERRYRGGVRNTFQRLWMRGVALDRRTGDDRWDLIHLLPEDAQVQIFERPSLSSSIRVARAIAEGWARARTGRETTNLEAVTRRAALLLLASSQVLALDSLTDERLAVEVDRAFETALAAAT